MQSRTRLMPVGEEEASPAVAEPSTPRNQAQANITTLLLLTLKTISQKTLIALSDLADLLLLSSAFALWMMIIAQPTDRQLIAVGGYSLFVLGSLWMRSRRARG